MKSKEKEPPVNPELEREKKEKDINDGKKKDLIDRGMLPIPPGARGLPL